MISSTIQLKNNFFMVLWLGVVVKYVLVQFYEKTCVADEIFRVLLAFILPDFVWCWWQIMNQILYAFSCLISKLFTLGNIIFNSASRSLNINYLGWIRSDVKQKGMEYLLAMVAEKIGKRGLFTIDSFHPFWKNWLLKMKFGI